MGWNLNNYMKSFKQFNDEQSEKEKKIEIVKYAIEELQDLKMLHDFRKPVTDDYLDELSDQLKSVGVEPEDILASKGVNSKLQKQYLFNKSAPGCGMGKGALGDLRNILDKLEQ